MPAGDLDTGVISDITLIPDSYFVQDITTYTIVFITEKNMYSPGHIQIEFNNQFILPQTGQTLVVTFIGDSSSLIP